MGKEVGPKAPPSCNFSGGVSTRLHDLVVVNSRKEAGPLKDFDVRRASSGGVTAMRFSTHPRKAVESRTGNPATSNTLGTEEGDYE